MTVLPVPPPPRLAHATEIVAAIVSPISPRAFSMMPPYSRTALTSVRALRGPLKQFRCPRSSAPPSLHMLEIGQTIKLIEVGEAVRSALCKPRAAEQPPILGRRAFVPSLVIARHGVFGCEGFDIRSTANEPPNRAESAFRFGGVDVLEDVGAHDEVADAQ